MRRIAALFAIWIVACAVVAGLIAPAQANTGFRDSAAVLAFISLTAVAIERGIEGFFTVLSGRLGEWWPLKTVRDEFDTFEKQTNEVLSPVVAATIGALQDAQKVAGTTDQQIAELEKLIGTLRTEATRLQAQYAAVKEKLAPGSNRLARAGEINISISTILDATHDASAACVAAAWQALPAGRPDVAKARDGLQAARDGLQAANDLAGNASLIISSFSDNPARRAASLALGAGLGMLVAGGVGLNLFTATLAGPTGSSPDLPAVLAGWLGVVLTGIVIGLGSAPTHEVVKSLQAYKDSRNAPVDVATLASGSAAATAVIQEAAVPGGPNPAIPLSSRVYVVRRVRRSS